MNQSLAFALAPKRHWGQETEKKKAMLMVSLKGEETVLLWESVLVEEHGAIDKVHTVLAFVPPVQA